MDKLSYNENQRFSKIERKRQCTCRYTFEKHMKFFIKVENETLFVCPNNISVFEEIRKEPSAKIK